jgi:hypothetical protein
LKDNDINIIHPFNEDKTAYISAIDFYFPDAKLMEKLEELDDKDRVDKYISQKFNGDIVMSWLPNLKGKELGAAMSKFKNHFEGDNFKTFVLSADYETIRRNFMRIYNGESK